MDLITAIVLFIFSAGFFCITLIVMGGKAIKIEFTKTIIVKPIEQSVVPQVSQPSLTPIQEATAPADIIGMDAVIANFNKAMGVKAPEKPDGGK